MVVEVSCGKFSPWHFLLTCYLVSVLLVVVSGLECTEDELAAAGIFSYDTRGPYGVVMKPATDNAQGNWLNVELVSVSGGEPSTVSCMANGSPLDQCVLQRGTLTISCSDASTVGIGIDVVDAAPCHTVLAACDGSSVDVEVSVSGEGSELPDWDPFLPLYYAAAGLISVCCMLGCMFVAYKNLNQPNAYGQPKSPSRFSETSGYTRGASTGPRRR